MLHAPLCKIHPLANPPIYIKIASEPIMQLRTNEASNLSKFQIKAPTVQAWEHFKVLEEEQQ